MVAVLREGLERAGYAALLSPGKASFTSLRPAIEAYTRYHQLRTDAPLEALIKHMSQPRCCRPDIDVDPSGEPPSAKVIEAVLSGDRVPWEAKAAGTVYWTHAPITITYEWTGTPDAGDALKSPVQALWQKALDLWMEICGIELELATPSSRVNIRAGDGFIDGKWNVLAWSHVAQRNQPAQSTLQQKYDSATPWDDELLWTTIWHELGHAFGSDHIPGNNIMAPVNNRLTVPGPGDRRFAVGAYGEPKPRPQPKPPAPSGEATATFSGPGLTVMVQGQMTVVQGEQG